MKNFVIAVVMMVGFPLMAFSQAPNLSKEDFNVIGVTQEIDEMIAKLQSIKAKIQKLDGIVVRDETQTEKVKSNQQEVQENIANGTLYWDSSVGYWASGDYVYTTKSWTKRSLLRPRVVTTFIQQSNCPNGNCPNRGF